MKTLVGYDGDDAEPPAQEKAEDNAEAPRLGQEVKIIDGPFAYFEGAVETVNEEKQKVHVQLSMFGRRFTLELNFTQVENLV